MNKALTILITAGIMAFTSTNSTAHPDDDVDTSKISKLKLENLMSDKLARVNDTEVIVSRVTIPPHTSLPKHWHPGEEFAYVIKGSVTLWQQGKTDIIGNAGDVVKVPLKQIHTAKTTEDGAVILVFRVHESGQPERVKVE